MKEKITVDHYLNEVYLENHFENYDATRENYSPAAHHMSEKMKGKLKKALKIGAIAGAVVGVVLLGPEIIAALAPVLPAMKAALKADGVQAKGVKNIIMKFHEKKIGKLPEGDDHVGNGKKILGAILEWFKGAKARKDAGTATAIDNIALNEANNTLKKLSNDKIEVGDVVAQLDAEEAGTAAPKLQNAGGGGTPPAAAAAFDLKGLMPLILIAVVLAVVSNK